MQTLREILNETISVYINEIEEINVGFRVNDKTDFTKYIGLPQEEDIFEYGTEFLYCENFYCHNKYDWNTVCEFIKELKKYSLLTDDNMKAIKECWDNAQEMLEMNRQFYEKKEIVYDELIEELQDRINVLCIPFQDIKCGETISEIKGLIEHAQKTNDLDLMTKLKDIADYIIPICQQEGFSELLIGLSSLHINYNYNKLVDLKATQTIQEKLYETEFMDAKNITSIIRDYAKSY